MSQLFRTLIDEQTQPQQMLPRTLQAHLNRIRNNLPHYLVEVLDSFPSVTTCTIQKAALRNKKALRLKLGLRKQQDGSQATSWAYITAVTNDNCPPVFIRDEVLCAEGSSEQMRLYPRSVASLLRRAENLYPPFCFLQFYPSDNAGSVRDMFCALLLHSFLIASINDAAIHWNMFEISLLKALRFIENHPAYIQWQEKSGQRAQHQPSSNHKSLQSLVVIFKTNLAALADVPSEPSPKQKTSTDMQDLYPNFESDSNSQHEMSGEKGRNLNEPVDPTSSEESWHPCPDEDAAIAQVQPGQAVSAIETALNASEAVTAILLSRPIIVAIEDSNNAEGAVSTEGAQHEEDEVDGNLSQAIQQDVDDNAKPAVTSDTYMRQRAASIISISSSPERSPFVNRNNEFKMLGGTLTRTPKRESKELETSTIIDLSNDDDDDYTLLSPKREVETTPEVVAAPHMQNRIIYTDFSQRDRNFGRLMTEDEDLLETIADDDPVEVTHGGDWQKALHGHKRQRLGHD